jgi:hypothetical protein
MMFKKHLALVAACALGLASAHLVIGSPDRRDARALVRHLAVNIHDDQAWARLYRVGDAAIDDLIQALEDPDTRVSATAQRMIRYLGNPAGMRALVERYARTEPDIISGPVPIPLNEWDYDLLEQALAENDRTGQVAWGREYVYALALDGSPRAQATLDRAVEQVRRLMKESLRGDEHTRSYVRSVLENLDSGAVTAVFGEDGDLADAVKKRGFLFAERGERCTSARVVGYNGAEDKALMEVCVGRGRQAETCYRVVVGRQGGGWRLFSYDLFFET